MIYCDAHIHAVKCLEAEKIGADGIFPRNYRCCSCAHTEEEFSMQEKMNFGDGRTVIQAFGIHPQNPALERLPFLEMLLKDGRISCIGETGMDLFSPPFRESRERQVVAWHESLELAFRYGKTVVVHNRKALDQVFSDIKLVKRVPCVVFHSFAFGPREALAILGKGVNAYFSFGKPILNGNKKSIACVESLSLDRLLLETDAPYQRLKDEPFTRAYDIKRVYEEAARIRKIDVSEMCFRFEENFVSAFGAGL